MSVKEHSDCDAEVTETTREILLSFHDRKKIAMPKQSEMNESDVDYLTAAFKELFSYISPSSSMTINLQCYDQEWDEYIDIDADAVLINRDRVKVVACDTAATTSYGSTLKTNTSLSSSIVNIDRLSDNERNFSGDSSENGNPVVGNYIYNVVDDCASVSIHCS